MKEKKKKKGRREISNFNINVSHSKKFTRIMVIKGRFSKKPPKPVIKIPKNYNPYISKIASLKRKPLQQDATDLLFEIANIVTPIMKEYGYKVTSLNEMSPKSENLLGLNVNHGAKIFLRLRPQHNDLTFLPKEQLIGTMLHELTHNTHGPHDQKFYKHLDEMTSKQETYMMKGIDGKSMGSKFEGNGVRLGGRDIANVYEARLKKLTKLYTAGTNALGGEKKDGDLRDLVREAALKRYEDNKWCNQGQKGDLPEDDDLIIIDDADEAEIERKRGIKGEEGKKRQKTDSNQVVIIIDDDDDGDIDNDNDNINEKYNDDRSSLEIIDLT